MTSQTLDAVREAQGRSLNDGKTVMHLAVLGGTRVETVRVLAEGKRKLLSQATVHGLLPIHFAVRLRDEDMVAFLRHPQSPVVILQHDPFESAVNDALAYLQQGGLLMNGISLFAFACCHSSTNIVAQLFQGTEANDVLSAFLLVCALGELVDMAQFMTSTWALKNPQCDWASLVKKGSGLKARWSNLLAFACTNAPCAETLSVILERKTH